MDEDALLELEIEPIETVDYVPSPAASHHLRFGDEAADLAAGAPAPGGGAPTENIPAYSLQAPSDGVTMRDAKVFGVGAIVGLLLGWMRWFGPSR